MGEILSAAIEAIEAILRAHAAGAIDDIPAIATRAKERLEALRAAHAAVDARFPAELPQASAPADIYDAAEPKT